MAFENSKERLEFETQLTGASRTRSDLEVLGRSGKKAFSDVEEATDDARNAIERYADVVDSDARETISEVQGIAAAYDALARAAGPELTARSGPAMDQMIADLRSADVPFQAIIDDADRLATTLARLDDVRIADVNTRVNDLDGSVRRVSDSTERTGSVFANFAGNAAQDIPGISGSFGALNVAVGQFAEYATEGGIAMKSLVKAAAPILGVTILIDRLGKMQQASAQAGEENRKAIEGLAEAMQDGATAGEALTSQLRDAQAVMVNIQDFGSAGSFDVTTAIVNAGLSLEQFTSLAEDGQESIDAWRDSLIEQGSYTQEAGVAYFALSERAEQLAAAEDLATRNARFFGDAQGTTAEALDTVRGALDHATEATEEHTQAQEAAADAISQVEEALDHAREAIDEWEDATRSVSGLQVDLSDAMLDSADALDDYRATLADAEATDRDKIRASNDLYDAFVSEADVARETAEAQATAAGDAAGAVQAGVDAQIATLERLRENVDPDSPLRAQIQGLIDDLRTIEGTHEAKINFDLSGAESAVTRVRQILQDVQVAIGNAGTGKSGATVNNYIYGTSEEAVGQLERKTLSALMAATP